MRKNLFTVAAVSAAILGGSSALNADEMTPTTQPAESAEAAPKPKKKNLRLWGPYKSLKSLSSEQTEKILAIHEEFLAARKALEAKQESDIDALLTEEQRTELKAIADAPKEPKESKKADGDND